jgi:hypothetical protein
MPQAFPGRQRVEAAWEIEQSDLGIQVNESPHLRHAAYVEDPGARCRPHCGDELPHSCGSPPPSEHVD